MTKPDDTDLPTPAGEGMQKRNADAKEPASARRKAWRSLIAGLLLAGFPVALLIVGMVSGIRLHRIAPQPWMFGHAVMALAGLWMGWISWRTFRRIPGPRLARVGAFCVVVIGLISVTEALGVTSFASYLSQHLRDLTRHVTFAGDSSRLERTVIVPTLDSPSPPGKNVIWCSSFQLAWDEIRDNVIGAPLDVVGAEEVAARLNQSQSSRADLEPESAYATAGWKHDGIIGRIEKEMEAEFPSQELPDFNDFPNPDGILAYSYLTAHVPFTHPFRQVEGGFTFTDPQGSETNVKGFGLWEAYRSRYEDIREQAEVLYVLPEDPDHLWGTKEYALDLCRHSKPYQVIVAVVEPMGSLAETYEHVQRGMEQFEKQRDYEQARWFQQGDELKVPELFYRVDHRFTELIGKTVANVEMPILEAMQSIELRLDRSGATIESVSFVAVKSEPRAFLFNRPFLIYMKKRDAERPFFVMWVDNAELLVRE